ncbi:Fe-S cluster assembly protein SufD [Wenzhouxiangella sp. AB-CW3]|uniref:Fe-S cluster assembly protein SufD n=1 Tax=Wenzhouxiangella sp. AB-CW3 TaxID=2771012 RepID=UPI00168A4F80|nr:Fe-S cluster assembly protein SufD [Wenzhouxiangella sp. AB-CW3]QOC21706.1 Fe-S cluster assembly protein SufD [Wenzhouxiangella sp. AB-CW3]
MSALLDRLAGDQHLPGDDFGAIRRRAQQALMQHGFPDLKTEDWKYTPLKLLEKREFNADTTGGAALPGLPFEATVLHFDNGCLDLEGLKLPEGLRIEPIGADSLEQVEYGDRADAFAWLNLARFQQGLRLVIESDQDRPVVLATTTNEGFAAAVHPRLEIEVAEGASATLIDYQQDAGAGLINRVVDVELAKGAKLNHVIRRGGGDSAWIERSVVNVSDDADYRVHVLDCGGRLTRQDLSVQLMAEGANGEIDGIGLVNTRQHIDYHTAIDHTVGHTSSRESFRLLGDGSGVGVFNGRIHIHKDADDSHSDLETANLLLSEHARINTKPELEIYAEEVTASHGATIGQLDDDAMFYLRSRGIPADEAGALLKYGFAAAPLEGQATEPVREWLLGQLREVL